MNHSELRILKRHSSHSSLIIILKTPSAPDNSPIFTACLLFRRSASMNTRWTCFNKLRAKRFLWSFKRVTFEALERLRTFEWKLLSSNFWVSTELEQSQNSIKRDHRTVLLSSANGWVKRRAVKVKQLKFFQLNLLSIMKSYNHLLLSINWLCEQFLCTSESGEHWTVYPGRAAHNLIRWGFSFGDSLREVLLVSDDRGSLGHAFKLFY